MTFRRDALFSLFLVLVFAWAVWVARDWQFRVRLFPWAIGIPILALAIAQLALDLRRGRRPVTSDKAADTRPPATPETSVEIEPPLDPTLVRRRTASIVGWILGFFLAIWLLGFPIAVPLCTFLYLKFAARENWLISILLTAVAWGFLYGLFERMLHLPFPEGELSSWMEALRVSVLWRGP